MLFLHRSSRPKALLNRVETHLLKTQALLRAGIKQSIKRSDANRKKTKTKSKIDGHSLLNKPAKSALHLNRQRLLQVLFFLTLAGMASHSIPANASMFDPIRRALSPFVSVSAGPDPAQAQPSQIITEQALLDPSITSNPVVESKRLMLTQDRPSLLNVMNAEFLANRGDINTALKIYKQESLKEDSTSVFERALELSMLYESPSDSLDFALAWQQQNPEHIPALFYVAHLALKANDYDLAGEVLSEILDYDPQADLSEILIGIYPTKRSDQRLLLETVLSLPKHNNSSILVLQAGLMSQLGQPEIGLVSVNRALKSLPDNTAFIVLKADILKQLKTDREVLQYVSSQRKRIRNSKTLYLYEIRYRLDLGQTQEAWELLLKAHDLFQDDEVTLLAALVSIDIQAYAEADDLLSSLASSPYYIDQAYYYLGVSAERQQRFDRAERFLAKVMQENLVLKARQKLVSIQLLQGQPERALQTLSEFSKQFEVYAPDSAIMQADILRQQGKLIEAQNILAETNRSFPDDTKLLFARAQLLDNDQDPVLKKKLLNHLILLNPENPDYKLTLATVLFETGDELEVQRSIRIAQSILDIPFSSRMFRQKNYLAALNIVAADALSEERYQDVVTYLEPTYEISPTLDAGIILLRAYQGLDEDDKVSLLFNDLQSRFALGQQDISDRLQAY